MGGDGPLLCCRAGRPVRPAISGKAQMTIPAVTASGIVKRYGDVTAVNRLDLTVQPGDVYGVLGPNGAGKTTFLRILFGLIRADEGSFSIFGRTFHTDGMACLDGVAGFIESPKFYPYMSGRQNLALLAALDGGDADARIEASLERVHLDQAADRNVGGYSFGMRQRLGVAAALIRDPKLLVLDEPANGLDPAGIRDMRALVKELAQQGLTVLLSSHNMLEVEEICDHVTIMNTGNVVYHGSIADLKARAPKPGYALRTSDDQHAASICTDVAGVAEVQHVDQPEGGLLVRADAGVIDKLTIALGAHEIGIRSLIELEAPLESLFFELTEGANSPHAAALAPQAAHGDVQ